MSKIFTINEARAQDLTDYSYETILNMVKEWGK